MTIDGYIDAVKFEFEFISNNLVSPVQSDHIMIEHLHTSRNNKLIKALSSDLSTLYYCYYFRTYSKPLNFLSIHTNNDYPDVSVDMFITDNDYRFQIESIFSYDELQYMIQLHYFNSILVPLGIEEAYVCGDTSKRINVYKQHNKVNK